jgi:hypothetical protein
VHSHIHPKSDYAPIRVRTANANKRFSKGGIIAHPDQVEREIEYLEAVIQLIGTNSFAG